MSGSGAPAPQACCLNLSRKTGTRTASRAGLGTPVRFHSAFPAHACPPTQGASPVHVLYACSVCMRCAPACLGARPRGSRAVPGDSGTRERSQRALPPWQLPRRAPGAALACLTSSSEWETQDGQAGRGAAVQETARGSPSQSPGAGGEAGARHPQAPGVISPPAPGNQRRAWVPRGAEPAEGAPADSRRAAAATGRFGGVCAPQTRARSVLPGAVRVP